MSKHVMKSIGLEGTEWSRKPLCPLGAVGSNPIPSAIWIPTGSNESFKYDELTHPTNSPS